MEKRKCESCGTTKDVHIHRSGTPFGKAVVQFFCSKCMKMGHEHAADGRIIIERQGR